MRGAVSCVFLIHLAIWFPRGAEAYSVSAKAAIFSNSTKVIRYYGKNVHARVLPASTTKVMTALLVLERLPMNKTVRFSKNSTGTQPSKLYARPGERFKVRDLLYAIMLRSANDAAVALAEEISGTHWQFVNLMNRRAKALGCRNTKFANANGLPSKESQYSTPYDMYLIFREAIKHPFFKTLVHTKYKTIRSTSSGRTFKLKTHNKILFFDWKRKLYGKTGYTRAAGPCFVGYLMRGDDVCIIVVFNASRRWQDIKHIVSHYGKIQM